MKRCERERARVWLFENNHHACDALGRGVPKDDDVKFLSLTLDEVYAAGALDERERVAKMFEALNLPDSARMVRDMGEAVVADPSSPLRPRS